MISFRSARRPLAACLTTAAVLTVVAGCSSSSSSSGAAGSTTTITVGIGGPVADLYIPTFGSEQGIFAKYGLTVKFTPLTATTMLPTLSAGRVDYVATAGPQPELVALKGVNVKSLAVWADKPDFQVVAAGNVKTLQDLRGKRLGITSTGSTTTIFLEKALQKAGLTDSNVKLVPLGNTGSLVSAFSSGQIDAFVAGPPTSDGAAKSVKGGSLLLDFKNGYSWPYAEMVGYMPYASTHKKVTENLIRALRDSVAAWKSKPAAAQTTIKNSLKSTAEGAKESYEASLTTLTDSLVPTAALEKTLLASITNLAPQAKTTNPASLIDASYARTVSAK